jgi:hypothetical protein
MRSVFDKVQAGMRVLDKRSPGWFLAMNPATLNIISTEDCVLGQVFGSWDAGLRALHIGDLPKQQVELGFNLRGLGAWQIFSLNREWRTRIMARQMVESAILTRTPTGKVVTGGGRLDRQPETT